MTSCGSTACAIPWRFSIDPVDRLVYIGDVGQEAYEEIDVVVARRWRRHQLRLVRDGRRRVLPSLAVTKREFTHPVLQYSHAEGCSVTGGYVYRGACHPRVLRAITSSPTGARASCAVSDSNDGSVFDQFDHTDDLGLGQVTSFGVDNDGELLVVNWDGELHRIIPVR